MSGFGRRMVSVIGSSTPDEETYALARRLGFLLGSRGLGVVCGGRGGVMEAVCRGAREAGGLTVGIVPGRPEEANPFVDVLVVSGVGEARNLAVVLSGEAVVAVGGGFGTLSEMGFALKLGKPLVGLRTWRCVDERGRTFPELSAQTPEEALEILASLMGLV